MKSSRRYYGRERKESRALRRVLRKAKFEAAKPREMCGGRQRDVRRACEIHKFRGFDDREERIGDARGESTGEVTCELRQKNVRTNVQSATRVHVSEACEGCRPSAIGDHAMGGEVEGDVV